ncbi:MAG: DNA polymerase III subunit beta [Anaerolineae bacterium]|nr:DNA polymerase III subunit beta [Anaerolineae bacterium]
MRVSCLQENLARGLGIAGRAVSSRMSLPILSNVLVATDEGRLRLSATNLEIAITCSVGAKVEAEGAIAVPARTFADFVATLPPLPLLLEADPATQTLHIQCGRTKANLKGSPAEDFPARVQAGPDGVIELDSDLLRSMISQVTFAAAPDMERPILAGVLAEFAGPVLTLVAADSFRLSLRRAALKHEVPESTQTIIPARALNEVARIASDTEGPIRMHLLKERSQVLFRIGDVELVSQLVEGLFPDYKQIIPKTYLTRTVVDTKELQAAVRRTSIIARGANNIIRLQIHAEEGDEPSHLTVSAVAAELGDNVVDLDALVEGESTRVAFNARYLLDLLDVVTTENVVLETSSPSSPGVFRPVGPEAEDFTHIVMPMYVAD